MSQGPKISKPGFSQAAQAALSRFGRSKGSGFEARRRHGEFNGVLMGSWCVCLRGLMFPKTPFPTIHPVTPSFPTLHHHV